MNEDSIFRRGFSSDPFVADLPFTLRTLRPMGKVLLRGRCARSQPLVKSRSACRQNERDISISLFSAAGIICE